MNLLKVFSNKNNIYMWLVCMISVILTGCQLKDDNITQMIPPVSLK